MLSGLVAAAENFFGHRIFEIPLDGASHGAGAVLRIVALDDEEFFGVGLEDHGDVFGFEAVDHFLHLEVDNLLEVALLQAVEDDDIVQAVEELGLEDALGLFHHLVAHAFVALVEFGRTETEAGLLFQQFGADVGRHDDDGVAEIDLAAEGVGQFAFLEDLQEQMHDIRVGFFHFIEKDHRIRAAAHGLAELTAFLVPDIAGRRADEAGGGELFHVFRHVDLDERVGIAEHEFGEGAGEEGLTNTGRAEKNERSDRAARVFEVGPGAAEGLADGNNRFVLADDRLLQFAFHGEEFARLVLVHAGQGNAGPFGNDVEDFVFADDDLFFVTLGAPVGHDFFQLLAGLLLAVAKGGGFFEILRLDGRFFFSTDFLDGNFQSFNVGRPRHVLDTGAGTGFVHHVDGFIREETAGDVAVG